MEKDKNDGLLIEHKEEIHIFHKSMDLLISSILNNNNKTIIKPIILYASKTLVLMKIIRSSIVTIEMGKEKY